MDDLLCYEDLELDLVGDTIREARETVKISMVYAKVLEELLFVVNKTNYFAYNVRLWLAADKAPIFSQLGGASLLCIGKAGLGSSIYYLSAQCAQCGCWTLELYALLRHIDVHNSSLMCRQCSRVMHNCHMLRTGNTKIQIIKTLHPYPYEFADDDKTMLQYD